MSKIANTLFVITVIGISTIGLSISGFAQTKDAPSEDKVTVVKKSVAGEVTGVMANFIGVSSGEKSTTGAPREFAFNLNKDVKLEHKKELKQIGVGDTVKVDYDEVTTEKSDGSKSSKRVARTISFMKSAPTNQLISKEPEATP